MTTKTEPEEQGPRPPDDYERTLSFIEERLRAVGYNDMQAMALAEAGVDWHKAVALLREGCDPETAVDILL